MSENLGINGCGSPSDTNYEAAQLLQELCDLVTDIKNYWNKNYLDHTLSHCGKDDLRDSISYLERLHAELEIADERKRLEIAKRTVEHLEAKLKTNAQT